MSKKKSKRKLEKAAAASQRAPRRFVVIFLVAAVIASAVIFWKIRTRNTEEVLLPLSTLDLSHAEPQVADKIRNLMEQVKQNPDSAESWGKLAMNLDVHDFRTESIPLYKQAADIDAADFRWRYFGAIVLAETGSEEALEWFEASKEIRADYVPLLVRYGDALFRFGKPHEAASEYQAAIELDPNSSHALVGLAQIEIAENNLKQGKDYLEKALQMNPSHLEAKHLLSSVNRRLLKTDEAETSVVNEKTPLPDPVYASLIAEGISSLWYSYRGKEYLRAGQADRAIAEFETAFRLRPDAQTQEDLAAALDQAGKYEEALEHYTKAVKLHPVFNNFEKLGVLHGKLGRFNEAEEFLKKAIALNPDSPEAHFNLSVLYGRTDRYPEAIGELQKVISLKPDHISAHYHLGLAYLAVGNRSAAQQQYKALARLDAGAASRLKERIASIGAAK